MSLSELTDTWNSRATTSNSLPSSDDFQVDQTGLLQLWRCLGREKEQRQSMGQAISMSFLLLFRQGRAWLDGEMWLCSHIPQAVALLSHVFTRGSILTVLRTGSEQATAPPVGMKHLFQENHGSNYTKEPSQTALCAADRSSGTAEKQSLSVCSIPGVPMCQHHGAVPSRLPVPVKPHHRRAELARPHRAIVTSI